MKQKTIFVDQPSHFLLVCNIAMGLCKYYYIVQLSLWTYLQSTYCNQDQRTSLDLTPDRSLHLGNKFSLSFDIKLREELHTYGYVFRIISDDTSSCLDFISYQLRSKFNFILNKGSSIVENVDFIDSTQIVKDEWIKIRLDFTEQGIKISVNEATQDDASFF